MSSERSLKSIEKRFWKILKLNRRGNRWEKKRLGILWDDTINNWFVEGEINDDEDVTPNEEVIRVPDNMVTDKRDGACTVDKLTKSIIGVRLDCMNKFACMGLHVHGFEMRCGMCCGCALVSKAMWRSLIRLCFWMNLQDDLGWEVVDFERGEVIWETKCWSI